MQDRILAKILDDLIFSSRPEVGFRPCCPMRCHLDHGISKHSTFEN